ncbi:hypothetical protein ACRAKI_23680 [Saccharothrix isguenensis]
MFRTAVGRVAAVVLLPSALLTPSASADPVRVVPTSVVGSDGRTYTVTNHLVGYGDRWKSHEWLLVWSGGTRAADGAEPDFLAVVDASADSPTYGKVVNTATVGPQSGNEPHHLQYTWRPGQRLYAGGILSDTVFVLDVDELPLVRITGVNLPMDTPCGTAPDAFAVLRDGTAYGTYMGGPNVPGPCTYTTGEVRQGNGFTGTPGEVVRLDTRGKTLAELPAASLAPEDAVTCPSVPALPVLPCATNGFLPRQEQPGMVYVLDIRDPIASGDQTTCSVDELAEVERGASNRTARSWSTRCRSGTPCRPASASVRTGARWTRSSGCRTARSGRPTR